ncbi:MAG: NmrA/HSCARG family protein [Nitrospirota bacterium]|nr:NmrA/HSCARG family protein [Nitrospirota bacterium]
MANKKLIAVVGATGAQGGGLVRAILADPSGGYAVRAITRDTNSAKARELARMGAQVVAADVGDPDSLNKAFQGAYGAFCVTFFWEHFSPELELTHARNMAQAAKQAGVKHAIWSTLEDTRNWVPLDDDRMPTLMGQYKVPHFDAKGEADAVFREMGPPTTCLRTSFYWDNLIHFGMGPKRGADGKLVFTLPMGDRKLPGIAASDIGPCAYAIFKAGERYMGKTVGIAGEHLTGAEMAAALSRAMSEEVAYQSMAFAAYRNLGFPGAEDLGNMFQFKHDFNADFCTARDPQTARALYPATHTFASWLVEHKGQIAVE